MSEKYKLCPDCGCHNNPLAIECEECGEDLSSVRIVDEQTEEQAAAAGKKQSKTGAVRMVRICEECGEKNDPQARKCVACGEDISMILPVADADGEKTFALAALDGKFSYTVSAVGEPVLLGREGEMREYLKNKLYVSRRHAELSVTEGRLQIRALETAVNGVHINGIAAEAGKYVTLHDGDVVGLGGNDPAVQKDAAYFRVMES